MYNSSEMQLYFIRHGESANNALYARTGASQGRSEDPDLTATGRKQALHLAIYLADPLNFEFSGITRRIAAMQRLQHPNLEAVSGAGGLTHLYSSLMVRAIATGSIVAEATGLALVGWPDLHEGGGIYLDQDPTSNEPSSNGDPDSHPDSGEKQRIGLPGKARAYFETHYPRLLLPEEVRQDGWWNRPFETVAERPLRAQRLLHELLRRHGAIRPDGSEDRVALISHGGFYNHFLRAVLGLHPRFGEDDSNEVWFELNNASITRLDYLDGQFILVYQNRNHFIPPELIT